MGLNLTNIIFQLEIPIPTCQSKPKSKKMSVKAFYTPSRIRYPFHEYEGGSRVRILSFCIYGCENSVLFVAASGLATNDSGF